MTLQELAEREYPYPSTNWEAGKELFEEHITKQRTGFLKGLQVGMELLDWASENCLYRSVDGETIWMLKKDIYKQFRKEELLEIFIKERYEK